MKLKTYTAHPLAYVTGAVQARNEAMILRDMRAHPDLQAFEAGGTIDAPDAMPTGRQVHVYGTRFFELNHREA